MTGTLRKSLKILLIVMLTLSLVLTLVFYKINSGISPDADFTEQGKDLGIILEYLMQWSYLLFGTAILSSFVVFPIVGMISNPATIKKTILSVIGFAILIGISYSFADDTVMVLPGYTGNDNVPTIIKAAGTSLISMYILAGITITSVAFTEISKIFK